MLRGAKSLQAAGDAVFRGKADLLFGLNCRHAQLREGFPAPWRGLCLTDFFFRRRLCASGSRVGQEDTRAPFPRQGKGSRHLRPVSLGQVPIT